MRFPSIQQVFKQTGQTFKRFPLAILSSVSATAIAIYVVTEETSATTSNLLINFIMVAVLGISMFTAISLIIEEKKWNRYLKSVPYAGGLGLLVLYYFILPNNFDEAPAAFAYRYILYFIGVHLLAAMGPYWFKNKTSSFWQYNKTLFLRFLTAVLYSAVLFIGLAIALGAVEVLLGFDIDETRYVQLFFIIAGIFNTWFFLAGIPDPISKFNRITDYPKGLKIFTQNVLIPLVVVYLVILYLYILKIIFQWEWPEGTVSILVLSFSIAGILADLLLHPVRNEANSRWIKYFSKNYYRALIPLTILLLLAIGIRIGEYGFTVERYFVLVLGLWLTGIVGYFIISKNRNIKVIPGSLCIIAFLISFGPWGAFAVSQRNQLNRLQDLLQKNEMIKEKVNLQNSDTTSADYSDEIASTLAYLRETHGLNRKTVAAHLGMNKINVWENPNKKYTSWHFEISNRTSIPLEDYSWLIKDIELDKYKSKDSVKISRKILIVRTNSMNISIFAGEDPTKKPLIIPTGNLKKQLAELYGTRQYVIPPKDMVLTATNNWLSVKLYPDYISWKKENAKVILSDVKFDILLNFKQ